MSVSVLSSRCLNAADEGSMVGWRMAQSLAGKREKSRDDFVVVAAADLCADPSEMPIGRWLTAMHALSDLFRLETLGH